MPNTLRRKMFKLGGVANTHGVGITSGLKMKKGGKVDPQATFGVGNNALRKIGPDGKEREAHVAFLPYLGAGALALGRAGLSALRSPTVRQGITSAGKSIKDFISGGTKLAGGRPTAAQIARMTPDEQLRVLGKFGFGPGGRGSQILRATDVASTALAPVGITAALLQRAGVVPQEPKSLGGQLLTTVPKTALDITPPGIATALVQSLRSTEDDPKTKSLSDIIAGDIAKKEEKTLPQGDGDPMTTAENIEAEMAALKERALARTELYRDITGRPDNTQAIARALTAFGTQAAQGTGDNKADIAAALAAGSNQLFDEAAKREAFDQKLTGQAITDVLTDEATQKAILADAAKLGPTNLLQTQKVLEGLNAGITEQLQVNAKNEIINARPGVVYIDVTGVTGKKFVAINKSSESETFDNPEKAKEFAQTQSA